MGGSTNGSSTISNDVWFSNPSVVPTQSPINKNSNDGSNEGGIAGNIIMIPLIVSVSVILAATIGCFYYYKRNKTAASSSGIYDSESAFSSPFSHSGGLKEPLSKGASSSSSSSPPPSSSSEINSVSDIVRLVFQGSLFFVTVVLGAALAVISAICAATFRCFAAATENTSNFVEQANKDNMKKREEKNRQARRQKEEEDRANKEARQREEEDERIREAERENAFSKARRYFEGTDITAITWTDIYFEQNKVASDLKLGQGSSGKVYRAKWNSRDSSSIDVAIKVAVKFGMNDEEYEERCIAFKNEAQQVIQLRGKVNDNSGLITVLGCAIGRLSESLAKKFTLTPGVEAVGIVMRLETGGSVESLLYPPPSIDIVPTKLTLADKILLLHNTAKALEELHFAQICHGDIKPANILLADSNSLRVRLCDFGLSETLDLSAGPLFGESVVRQTRLFAGGTFCYMAPEMFPSTQRGVTNTASRSRSTDMYAFAIFCWEVLCGERPFKDICNPIELATRLQQDKERPDLNKLPDNTPSSVREMIASCWDDDKLMRKPVLEFLIVLNQAHSVLSDDKFDIFFSHPWKSKPFLSLIWKALTRKGYKVWYGTFIDTHIGRHTL